MTVGCKNSIKIERSFKLLNIIARSELVKRFAGGVEALNEE